MGQDWASLDSHRSLDSLRSLGMTSGNVGSLGMTSGNSGSLGMTKKI